VATVVQRYSTACAAWYLQVQFTPCVRFTVNVPSVQLRTRAWGVRLQRL
jgi:hypothetical protein